MVPTLTLNQTRLGLSKLGHLRNGRFRFKPNQQRGSKKRKKGTFLRRMFARGLHQKSAVGHQAMRLRLRPLHQRLAALKPKHICHTPGGTWVTQPTTKHQLPFLTPPPTTRQTPFLSGYIKKGPLLCKAILDINWYR